MSIENLLALNRLIKQFSTGNTEKHTPLCIKCKAELALVAACQCYEGNHIICDCCGKSVKDDIKIYHCDKSGYDLCVPCSYHHQHQTDEKKQQQRKRQITDCNIPCSARNNVLDCVYARALMRIVTRYGKPHQAIDYLQHNHNLTEIID
eukprot:1113405_1